MEQEIAKIRKLLEEMADKSSAKANQTKSAYRKAQHRGTAAGLHEAWKIVQNAASRAARVNRRKAPRLSDVLL